MPPVTRERRGITIRAAILRGFLVLVVTAVVLSGALSFIAVRRAFQSEIAENLGNSASGLLQRIDMFFFERQEEMREWRRVELMQDIRVGDVDKRVARFLSDLKAGHGDVYQVLYCTNLAGRVVASTDLRLLGKIRQPAPAMPDASQASNAPVVLEQRPGGVAAPGPRYVLRTMVPSLLGGGNLGYLYAELNWKAVSGFLADDVAGSGRTALLLDSRNRAIAAAGGLAARLEARAFPVPPLRRGAAARRGNAQTDVAGIGELLVGAAASSGYEHFSGFGWHIVVVEPTRVAFAPVWRLAWAMLGGLLFSLAVAAWLSMRLSSRLASPIGHLTEFARGFRRGRKASAPVVQTRISEVSELNQAFGDMIEALERSREHVVRAGKLAVVGEMAAIMTHEVRTPLGILKSSGQMLERCAGLTASDRELAGFIVSETDRLNGLVTTLLECASPRAPAFQPRDVHEIIRHVLSLTASKAQKNGIRLDARLAARQSVLACDREQMVQVVLNLVINALQHVPEGGRIRLSTSNGAQTLVVRVDDDGPGIAPDERDRVFDPFFTRRQGGVGLGLTIVQQIVHAHHGEITAGASPLGGAGFAVVFAPERQGELT
ncbi:MAG: ATP-binding protein [Betaproteobacteria bacterium]|nr:ATP-binding protein [Betaproteobacteria bacterium]